MNIELIKPITGNPATLDRVLAAIYEMGDCLKDLTMRFSDLEITVGSIVATLGPELASHKSLLRSLDAQAHRSSELEDKGRDTLQSRIHKLEEALKALESKIGPGPT
jgi:hypothetical protein